MAGDCPQLALPFHISTTALPIFLTSHHGYIEVPHTYSVQPLHPSRQPSQPQPSIPLRTSASIDNVRRLVGAHFSHESLNVQGIRLV
jgi:hypothetical protein